MMDESTTTTTSVNDATITANDVKISKSLDEIIKENRGNKKTIHNRVRQQHQGETRENSSVDPMSTSLDSIISGQKKQHHHVQRNKIDRKYNQGYNNGGGGHYHQGGNIRITIQQSRYGGGGNVGGGHPLLRSDDSYQHGGRQQYRQHRGGSPIQQRNRALLKQVSKIDHSLFDPRGIRDYSQVKKPNTLSMNGNGRGRRRMYEDDDSYDDEGCTIRVSNLAPSVTLRDLGRVFSVIGELRDFDILHHLKPVQASITFRNAGDAAKAIERFNGVPLDGQDLEITLEGYEVEEGDEEELGEGDEEMNDEEIENEIKQE